MRRVWLAIALLTMTGCAQSISTGVYGPYTRVPPLRLYEQVRTAVQARGYRVIAEDPMAGWFEVPSNGLARCRVRGTFVFQFYEGGWFEAHARGCGVIRTTGGQYRMHARLSYEYITLVASLVAPPEGS